MGIVISAGHIVIGMVAGDHHHRHEDDVLDALGFQLRNDRIQMGPAFDGIDEDIAQISGIEAVLDDGVVGIGRMRRLFMYLMWMATVRKLLLTSIMIASI